MNHNPTHSPARNDELLGQTAHRQDGDITTVNMHGGKFTIKDTVPVYLIRNDRKIVLASHSSNLHQVLGTEVTTARIRRVVDDDGLSAIVDQLVQRLQINFPRGFRLSKGNSLINNQ